MTILALTISMLIGMVIGVFLTGQLDDEEEGV